MFKHYTAETESYPPNTQKIAVLGPKTALAIAFVSSFCIMVLEIIAARLMAPFVGSGLFIWTAIIGVILTGISIGNYLSGRIADRWARRETVAILLIMSGVGSACILPSIGVVHAIRGVNAPLAIQLTLVLACVFLLPSLLLGTIGPAVARFALTDLRYSGSLLGKIYAANAVGSISGTFITGFLLIGIMGTRLIVWTVATGLIISGLLVALAGQCTRRWIIAFGCAFLPICTVTVGTLNMLASPCLLESAYACINVQFYGRNLTKRILIIDRLVHSLVDIVDQSYLGYSYQSVFADVVGRNISSITSPRFLLIGGGGYALARYLDAQYPNSEITVVELDPSVTEVAQAFLGLPLETRIITYIEDGRKWLNSLPSTAKFDVIIADATHDIVVPHHLMSREFNTLVQRHLTNDGIYLSTVIDGAPADLLRAHVGTLKTIFSTVSVSPEGQWPKGSEGYPFVIVAGPAIVRLPLYDEERQERGFISGEDVERFLNERPFVLLTDDFAPVDHLALPAFIHSQQ